MTQITTSSFLNNTCCGLLMAGHTVENLGLTGLYWNIHNQEAQATWVIGRTMKIAHYLICSSSTSSQALYNSFAEVVIDIARFTSISALHYLGKYVEDQMEDLKRGRSNTPNPKTRVQKANRPLDGPAYSIVTPHDPVIENSQWFPFGVKVIRTSAALVSLLTTNWVIHGQNRPTPNIDDENIALILEKHSITSIGQTDDQIKHDVAALFDQKINQLVDKRFPSFQKNKDRLFTLEKEKRPAAYAKLLQKLNDINCKFSKKSIRTLVGLTQASLYLERLPPLPSQEDLLNKRTAQIKKDMVKFLKESCEKKKEEWALEYKREPEAEDDELFIVLTSQKNKEIQR